MIGAVCRTVGIPQIVPLILPKFNPEGRLGLISQDVIVPEPVNVGPNGKSVLAIFLVKVKFSGEYESVGT